VRGIPPKIYVPLCRSGNGNKQEKVILEGIDWKAAMWLVGIPIGDLAVSVDHLFRRQYTQMDGAMFE
jgi:hypothetical protein